MFDMNAWRCQRFGGWSGSLMWVLGALLAGSGCSSTRGNNRDLQAMGLHYELKELQEPRPNRVHILRVDLANPAIRPAVVVSVDPDGPGPAEASLTDPRLLAHDPGVLAYINTNPWEALPDASGRKNRSWFDGQPVDIRGLAVSQGHTRSPSPDPSASVWVNEQGQVLIGDAPGVESAVEAMAGFQPVVTEGTIATDRNEVRHPRTAIGVNQEGTQMWLVVVDGRQAHYSEGMTLYELGQTMLQLGCWNAVNMDGGGSSIMGLVDADGQLRVVNSPSDRLFGVVKIRPLPMILTIREIPNR